MKQVLYSLGCAALAFSLAACGGKKAQNTEAEAQTKAPAAPEYALMDKPQANLDEFQKDADGYITIFDGKTMKGWRGYGRDTVPGRWVVEDGCIKFNGSGGGEAQAGDGGDLIFSHKFKNFELELEWKISKGGNSGILYLAQEVTTKDKDGNTVVDDMIPAVPQNAKPFGEWNKAKIMVYKGTVVHGQNDQNVLEYHLWTPKWTEMLQASKFSETAWPLAFELLNNCGGENHEGYIGLQDHGDDVWYRNIRVKILD